MQIELRSLAPDRRADLIERRDAYEHQWRATLEAAFEEGSLRPTDVRLTVIAILSACNWFTQWYRPDGSLTVDQIAASFADLFLSPQS